MTARPIAGRISALGGIGLLLLGCRPTAGQLGHAPPHVPGIRIVKAEQARARGLHGRPFELRFGDKQDGTKLVLDFLDRARRRGAKLVAGIRIELAGRRGATPVICASRLLPIARTEHYKVPHTVPGHTEQRMVMRPVTRTVTEYQYRCRMVSHPVSRMETSYRYQYDYATRSSRSVPVTRMVTRHEYRNECRSEPVTRTVTRYEHQYQTKYVPPKLTYLSAHYTDFNLVESRPSCAPASSAPHTRLPHRIVGTIYPGV